MPSLHRISDYRPTLADLRPRFRYWHVESLLNQSADLIDRCLDQLREFQSIDRASAQQDLDLGTAERLLALEEGRDSVFDRGFVLADRRLQLFGESQAAWASAHWHADALYKLGDKHGQGSAGWTRAGQNWGEKEVERYARASENDIASRQREWAVADAAYQRQVFTTHVETVRQRRAMTEKGEPFAMARQRDLVFERLSSDYRDALNRAVVAEEGLERIYGRKRDGAASVGVTPPEDASLENAISHVVLWVRSAIEWLIAYGQLEQGATRVVSLRSLLGDDEWADQVQETRGDSCAIRVRIPDSLFTHLRNARLRGIGASLVGAVGTVPWSCVVDLPNQAVYEREAGRVSADQTLIPKCVLGRVENRTSMRPVEICGQISLVNASPIGRTAADTWELAIERPAGTFEAFLNLEDVLLELNIVGVPLT